MIEELNQYLGRDDELFAYAALLSPLANKGLGRFVLAGSVMIRCLSQASGWIGDSLVVCGVDKVSLEKDQKRFEMLVSIMARVGSRLRQRRHRGA